MNWTAGILAFVLVYVPVIYIFYRFHKNDQEIERKYQAELERIRKRYGVE